MPIIPLRNGDQIASQEGGTQCVTSTMHLIIHLTAYTYLCHGYFTPGIENQNKKFALLSLRITFIVFTDSKIAY